MSKFATKVASAVLTATTVMSLSGLGSFAGVASAQTVDIASLLAQIAALQAQLAAIQGGGSTATACTITRDLTVGAKGADVTCLQNVLISKGFLAAGLNTGFFGALTKSAVAKWQGAAGIAPAAGYFGAKSRAAFSAMGGGQVGGSTGGTPVVVNPGTSLLVSAGAGAPVGSAIAGAGQIAVGRFSFTAPMSMGTTITGLTFNKVGVVSDSNISNLYLADVASGAIVAQYQSLTNSVATFGGLMLNVAAGQTWTGELRADISTSATSGNTIAFDLTGVTTAGNVPAAGLPVKGNVLTVTSVSNPSIATIALTANAVGSTIDAGTNSVLVSSWTTSVTNSAVNLKSLQFSFVGSANPADIRNLRLMVNGTQVATLATAATETVFALAGNPVKLQTGQSTIEIFADVAGSPNRTFTFSLLQPYKVNAVDTQYNAGITATVTSTNQTTITINTGSVTVQTASDSPSSPVPAGASAVVLGKFTIYAAGEAVKVKFLDVDLVTAGSATWATIGNVTDDLSNVRIIDDVGGQVGNNIATLAFGSSSGQCDADSSTQVSCHFGTSGSPVNYIVPANTTRTLSVIADIGSSTDMSTIKASLPTMTSNLEGQISFQAASSGTATGATRSVNTSPLTVAANAALVSPTYIAGTTQAKIGSFVLTASSAQAARVSSLTFDKDSNANFDMQNMTIKVGSTQFGTTRPTIGDAETSLAFSNATPITVAAGGSVTVDVYADILTTTTTTTHSAVIDLIGWSAIGATSGSSITFPGAAAGQSIVVSAGPTLTVAIGSDTPATKQLVMGTSGNSLATFRFTNDNVDDVRITDLTVSDTISNGSSGVASFEGLELFDGSTRVAGPLSMTVTGAASGSIAFSLSTPVTVPKNASKTLTLKGSVATYTSGGAVSNSSHIFKINAAGDITVQSVGSPSATVTVSGTPASGNGQAVYRTKLVLTGSATTGARTRSASDDIGTLTFAADSAYQARLNSVTLTFTGAAVTTHAGGSSFTVDLIDTNTGIALTGASQQTCTPTPVTSPTACNVTFTPSYTIDAGSTKTVTVRINSANFYNGSETENLSVQVTSTGGITFYDGVTPSTALLANVLPVTVATVSY